MITLLSCSSPALLISFILITDLISYFCGDQDSFISICFVSPLKNWFLSHSCDNIHRSLLTLDICPVGDPHLLEVSAIPLACHTLQYMRGQWLLARMWNIKCRSQLFCGFSDQKCVQQIEHWFIQFVIKTHKTFLLYPQIWNIALLAFVNITKTFLRKYFFCQIREFRDLLL